MSLPPVFGDLTALVPVVTLLVFAVLTLLFGVFTRERAALGALALTGVAAALLFSGYQWLESGATGVAQAALSSAYLGDGLALSFSFVILLGTGLAVVLADAHLARLQLDHPEFHPLLLLAATGALVLVAAGDLVTLLLGLEIMSLAVYVLAAWRERSRTSEEAGMKYFLLGAFASAVLVYGIALTYGATGRFDLVGIAAAVAAPRFDAHGLLLLGAAFLLVGLGFKVAFAPFHQWAPDVYTGAPTPVTAFMSVVVKTAAFGALLRVTTTLMGALSPGPVGEVLPAVLSVLVGLTLVVGNFGALLQSGIKRMLAYSAVAHAGYVGLAVLAGGEAGMRAAGFYLLAYTLTTLAAFAVLLSLMDDDDRGDRLERLAGLGRRRPWLAAALSMAMLSLAGFPPFAGFIGKVAVFQAAIAAGHVALAVLAIGTSVVAVVFYARVVTTMYLRDPDSHALPARRVGHRTAAVLTVGVVGMLLLGLFPGGWFDLVASTPWLAALY
ncbi:MAG: NADH-quinone oxidoreductase subunit N [bacterium]|nr:NADH-quinone oxidoreductase subunit N [bacterium]